MSDPVIYTLSLSVAKESGILGDKNKYIYMYMFFGIDFLQLIIINISIKTIE